MPVKPGIFENNPIIGIDPVLFDQDHGPGDDQGSDDNVETVQSRG